ncbi:hypothetical protein EW146_g4171 [Bondarzewia mesenterica]|uniref:Uncharacterized protein n=1 Tax=Bondarzewia mesenterica TaxID=1095465 RepID=A0A4S4LVA6_9AGAM|nr:hypothetical protein EW146_g4171 [Bondarzewia mesenterica]
MGIFRLLDNLTISGNPLFLNRSPALTGSHTTSDTAFLEHMINILEFEALGLGDERVDDGHPQSIGDRKSDEDSPANTGDGWRRHFDR